MRSSFFRISRKGVVKELFLYRGVPYILDNRNRLWAFNPSIAVSLGVKLPHITMQMLKHLPVAGAASLATTSLAFLDSATMGLVTANGFQPITAAATGFIGFYVGDFAYSMWTMSHKSIGAGGNFFTDLIEKNVVTVEADSAYDDFTITTKRRGKLRASYLSSLTAHLNRPSCAEYLTRLTLP
ncbi:MAG: hypothetical protein HC902_01920 [Calothrix sp. SM1_5_4]|nr:hypothetical protein [Calothrix sp. SM1_5_4]